MIIMKHNFSILIMVICLLACFNNIYAQSADEFCGDWVGTYTERLPNNNGEWSDTQVKMYIRINKMDSKYMVRIKTQSFGPDMNYWPTCENVSRQGNSLYFTMDLGEDHDWSGNARENGQRIKYAHFVLHSSVSVEKGIMHYKEYMKTIYYGNSGKIGDERAPVNGGYLKEVTLYKDDGW